MTWMSAVNMVKGMSNARNTDYRLRRSIISLGVLLWEPAGWNSFALSFQAVTAATPHALGIPHLARSPTPTFPPALPSTHAKSPIPIHARFPQLWS